MVLELDRRGYRTHEFGDFILIDTRRAPRPVFATAEASAIRAVGAGQPSG
jgi:hypothetical protein